MSNFEKDKQYWDSQFQTIFGEELIPFAFQRKVAQHLLSGCNVILQAPTGAGKTKAALFPFLLAQRESIPFPERCFTLPQCGCWQRVFTPTSKNTQYSNR